MKQIIIGLGEIGQAVNEIIGKAETYDLKRPYTPEGNFEVMHICFPYADNFIQQVKLYKDKFKASRIIIWSTVPIGITKQIKGAVHSPVEGKHPKLVKSIKEMVRWVGVNNKADANYFENYFKELKLKTKIVSNSDYTEALKLLSTTEYAINVVFADYKARIAKDIGMNYELTKQWNRDYNQLYRELGLHNQFQKFVLDPPNGKIGGHCLLPNAKLLGRYDQYPDKLIDIIRGYDDD